MSRRNSIVLWVWGTVRHSERESVCARQRGNQRVRETEKQPETHRELERQSSCRYDVRFVTISVSSYVGSDRPLCLDDCIILDQSRLYTDYPTCISHTKWFQYNRLTIYRTDKCRINSFDISNNSTTIYSRLSVSYICNEAVYGHSWQFLHCLDSIGRTRVEHVYLHICFLCVSDICACVCLFGC